MADQTRRAQFGQGAEVFGDRVLPHAAQIDDVEMVAAELTQVLLDVGAQVLGAGGGAPLPRPRAVRADLGGDHEVVGVGGSALLISSLAERRDEK